MTIQNLLINEISVDHKLQSRVAINTNTVKEYAESIRETAPLPPLTVFHDGLCYVLADGFHRLEAHKILGRDRVTANVLEGSRRDAFLYALSANAEHGLRRSQADKRRAVQMSLEDPELGQRSNREIAKLCKVSHSFVNSTRESLKPKPVIKPSVVKTNWPNPEPRVETFPHDISHEGNTYELAEALDTINLLADENAQLQDRVALAAWDATEEEKAQVTETIRTLRNEIKLLTIERNSLRDSRNSYQNQNSQLIRQCANYQAVIKKLNQQIEALESKFSSGDKFRGTPSKTPQSETHPTGTPDFGPSVIEQA